MTKELQALLDRADKQIEQNERTLASSSEAESSNKHFDEVYESAQRKLRRLSRSSRAGR